MYMLWRRIGQEVEIGDVRILIEHVTRGKVRLGIVAPVEKKIIRMEKQQAQEVPIVSGCDET